MEEFLDKLNPALVFGVIFLIISIVVKCVMKTELEENDYICQNNYNQALKDIKTNKITSWGLLIASFISIIFGVLLMVL